MSKNMNVGNDRLSDISKAVDSYGIHPLPLDIETVEVEVNPSDSMVFQEYCAAVYSQIESVISHRGGQVSFSEQEFQDYCVALVRMRVSYVRGERLSISNAVNRSVPALLSLMLDHIGKAQELSLGLYIVPKFAGEEGMKDDEVIAFSRKLAIVSTLGLEVATQMPRSREGDYSYMTMLLVENQIVCREAVSHPVKAFLASFMAMQTTAEVLKGRVSYGYVSQFKQLVRGLDHVKQSG